ncbi:MAG: hypothetical protein R3B13_35005 [Polyangiaceae bacterium]
MSLRPSSRLLVAFLVVGATASAKDPTPAEVAFRDGLKALKAGDLDKACPRLAQSYDLDHQAGTLFTLADCFRKAGKTASALARYDEYLQLFEGMSEKDKKAQRGREKFVREHSRSLEKTVPRLTVRVSADSPLGTVVLRNGVRMREATLGLPLPLDPGEYVLSAKAPDGREVELPVQLAPGETRDVELRIAPIDGAPAPTPSRPRAAPPTQTNAPVPDTNTGSGQRTAGLVLMGAGAAALAVGAVTGVMVLGRKDQIRANCGIGGDASACNETGKAEADSAQTLALLSTVGFAVGIAGLGSGAALYFTAPRPAAADAGGDSAWSVGVAGRF